MAIRQLSLNDFRNLASTTIALDARLNLIQGVNGSGKTSLLEAIHVLCQGQSFRSHQLKQCIRRDAQGFLLFGRFDGFKAGVAYNPRRLEIRIDGETVARRSALVRRAPVQVINADSFQLIDGAPARRRAWLDWVLFHVEPDYAARWQACQHALRQRNRLLKDRRDVALLDYWDRHLAETSAWLEDRRRQTCARLREVLAHDMAAMLGEVPLELAYRRGWRDDADLLAVLGEDRERDLRLGYTRSGIHRDDIRLTSEGLPLDAILSRGQGKRVCMALILAVLRLVEDGAARSVILLVDDLDAELDAEARRDVFRYLAALPLQLVVTRVDMAPPDDLPVKVGQVFHVEHGTIRPRRFD